MSFIRLPSSEYGRVLPLITEDEQVFLPPTLGILEEIQPGVVYVDHRDAPTCAAVIRQNTKNVSARLLGNPTPAFHSGFVEYLQREMEEQEASTAKSLNIATATSAWENVIFRAVGYRVIRIRRSQFHFESADFYQRTAETVMPEVDGLSIRRIDKELIASSEMLTQYTDTLWNGARNYLTHGVGWVAMEGDAIQGSCDSVFVGGKLAELNIGIAKALRGRGVGYFLAVHFIRDCLAKGLVPNWTCDTENTASYQMAQKLGFTPVREYYNYSTHNSVKSHEPARS